MMLRSALYASLIGACLHVTEGHSNIFSYFREVLPSLIGMDYCIEKDLLLRAYMAHNLHCLKDAIDLDRFFAGCRCRRN